MIALFQLSCTRTSPDIDAMTLESAVSASLSMSLNGRGDFYGVLNSSVTLLSVSIVYTTSSRPTSDVTSAASTVTSNSMVSHSNSMVSGNSTARNTEASSTRLSSTSTSATSSINATWMSVDESTAESVEFSTSASDTTSS